MNSVPKQIGLFSRRQMSGYYRYKNVFQVLPLNVSIESRQIDFPLLMEIKYCPDAWPASNETFWYRDVWEKERLEKIKNKAQWKTINYDDDWIKAYQNITKMKRGTAIFEEVSNLLTLFTNHRFFKYNCESQWFISHDKGKDEFSSEWGQSFYNFPAFVSDSTELSSISEYEEIRKIDVRKYKKHSRDSYLSCEAEGSNDITFPDDIDGLFGKYFSLSNDNMEKFYTACKLYNQALELQTTHSSLSLVASATAIEALLNTKVEKHECGHEKSIERCDNVECGMPIYGLNSRFKQFFLEYGSDSPAMRKFASKFYSFRSGIAHGGLLRDDLHDSGFYSGVNDEEQAFRREALSITNHLLINWLVKV